MILLPCPHCQQLIEIEQINCSIFRHGVYRVTYQQINPHAPKQECDRLFLDGLIYGCGKPFRVITQSDESLVAEACDYI